jgi:RimJ/RimL family protein N-acetyltransferase
VTAPPSLSAAAIESDRLVLRKARDADREGIVEVLTDPEVRAYLGGPRPRAGVEQFLDRARTASVTSPPAASGRQPTPSAGCVIAIILISGHPIRLDARGRAL